MLWVKNVVPTIAEKTTVTAHLAVQFDGPMPDGLQRMNNDKEVECSVATTKNKNARLTVLCGVGMVVGGQGAMPA
ncbi:hypothetical protein A2U01_0030782 [Trifolium medium]|uniref:Uncharacterized protein n=1 Tax=Trifolium medium TaxID=97028 RepID=A0A392PFP1_9FABA|nr:hypothetical protein [Trifolium medium]